jgi:N-acetylglutamate synthase/N-acetylornithine aminotransferase
VLKVAVTGAPSDIFARDLGRFVTNSNLVKCAMAGCDPNVGRIVGKFQIQDLRYCRVMQQKHLNNNIASIVLLFFYRDSTIL